MSALQKEIKRVVAMTLAKLHSGRGVVGLSGLGLEGGDLDGGRKRRVGRPKKGKGLDGGDLDGGRKRRVGRPKKGKGLDGEGLIYPLEGEGLIYPLEGSRLHARHTARRMGAGDLEGGKKKVTKKASPAQMAHRARVKKVGAIRKATGMSLKEAWAKLRASE
jgi:hypothetical protein